MKIVEWIKNNKFITVVILVLAYFSINLFESFFGVNLRSFNLPSTTKQISTPEYSLGTGGIGGSFGSVIMPPTRDYAPQTDVDEGLVIQESSLSLLVKDVTDVRNKIVKYAQDNRGYMVNSSVSNPQDEPTSTVTIRVPADKLESALNYFHSLSVKVVSENLVGRDVTDQYVDIDKRIAQNERAISKLEAILDSATKVSDITSVTQQILTYQNQIDALKGQQDALKKNSELAKLTLYLSTDEIALPYAPSETFRPKVIFKLAVRSLVGTLRKLATLAIWAGVYAAVFVPAIIIIKLIWKWLKKRKTEVSKSD